MKDNKMTGVRLSDDLLELVERAVCDQEISRSELVRRGIKLMIGLEPRSLDELILQAEIRILKKIHENKRQEVTHD